MIYKRVHPVSEDGAKKRDMPCNRQEIRVRTVLPLFRLVGHPSQDNDAVQNLAQAAKRDLIDSVEATLQKKKKKDSVEADPGSLTDLTDIDDIRVT
jgi:hypothetical protein